MRTNLIALFLAGSLCGCEQPASNEALSARVATLEQELATQKAAVSKLDSTVFTLDLLSHGHSRAAGIRPTEPGFELVHTDVLPLVVSFHEIAPLGSGSNVTLSVGNPNTATIKGVALKIIAHWEASEDGTFKAAVESTYKFPGELPPGRWTHVTFPISGMKPDQLDMAMVSFEISTLSFH